MVECANCKENGVYAALVDRGDHYFCTRCFRRQEKQEPVKRVVYAVDPWDTEVKW